MSELKKSDPNKPAFKVFKAEAEAVALVSCPACRKPIKEGDFRDALSRKEYSISGLCQECQDSVFGAMDEG